MRDARRRYPPVAGQNQRPSASVRSNPDSVAWSRPWAAQRSVGPSSDPPCRLWSARHGRGGQDRRPRGRPDRTGAARAVTPAARSGAPRTGGRAPALRPLAGAPARHRQRGRHRGRQGDVRGRPRAQGRHDHPRGQGRCRLAEPNPARGGRRKGHRPHRTPAPRRDPDRRRPLPDLGRAHGGRRRLRSQAVARGRRRRPVGDRLPNGEDHALDLPRSRRVRVPNRGEDARSCVRRPEVDRVAGVRGDAQGGDGRGRCPAFKYGLRAGADRRHLRGPDVGRHRRAARDPGAEPRRRLPVGSGAADVRLDRRRRVGAAGVRQRDVRDDRRDGRGAPRHRPGARGQGPGESARDDPRLWRVVAPCRRPPRTGGRTRIAGDLRSRARGDRVGVKTPDLGGNATTTEFTTEVVNRVATKIEVWSSLGSAA